MDAPVARDIFASGYSVILDSDVGGDAHVTGFNINVKGRTTEDLYAAGSNISLEGPVGEDVSLVGFTVILDDEASIDGNARIIAGTTTINAPIKGSLIVGTGKLNLDSVIDGDVRLAASDITFGPNAQICGRLIYTTGEEMVIPSRVISSDRVQFRPADNPELFSELRDAIRDGAPSFWPSLFSIVGGFILVLAFLIVVAASAWAFVPRTVERLHKRASSHPGISLLFGFLGLATLFGLVPVSAMTLIGLPLIPIVILLIVSVWIAGYLIGVFTVSWRIVGAFRTYEEQIGTKLIVLACGLIVFAILNFIPFLGALINFAMVLLGLGAIAMGAVDRLAFLGTNAEEIAVADTGKKSRKVETE